MSETRIFSVDQLGEMPPPRWLIDELFEANSLVMVAGPPGSYKSFLVLDWMLCMAVGRSWNKRATAPSKVLYVLGEGKSSLLKRIDTWVFHQKLTPLEREALKRNFRVTFDVPQMAHKSSVDNLLSTLEAEGYAPEVIVIDTFARSFVGMDENSQKDVGMWVESADRLRSLGFTVIFLHHTAKNTEFGVRYRGSTAILGAMDTAMTLVRDGGLNRVKLDVTKQKDHDEGDPLYFSRKIILPAEGGEGSIVLVPEVSAEQKVLETMRATDAHLVRLLQDDSFPSDRARARVLAQLAGISEASAQTKIRRKRQELGESNTESEGESREGSDSPLSD